MSDNLPKLVESESKDLTTKTEFKPTPHMIVWLDAAIELQTDNITEIERQSKISAQSWYNWLKKDGFEDWYFENYKRMRRRWLPTLDRIGMANAKRDYNFWKDMKKAAGDSVDQSQVNVQFNKFEVVTKDGTPIDIK